MKPPHIHYSILIAAALLTAGLLWLYVPNRVQTRLQSVCRVTSDICYALPVGHHDTLYLSLSDGIAQRAGLRVADVAETTEISGCFVSREGHLLTTDSLVRRKPDVLTGEALRQQLSVLDSLVTQRLLHRRAERKELDDYARRHTVVDDGYNEVMAYRERVGNEIVRHDSILSLVHRGLKQQQLRAHLTDRYAVRPAASDTAYTLRRVMRKDGLMLLCTTGKELPQGASRFSVHRTGAYTYRSNLYAFQDFGGQTAGTSPVRLTRSETPYPATEGGAWVNPSGQLCGIACGDGRISSRRIAELLSEVQPWPVWWWTNFKAWLRGLSRTAPTPVASVPSQHVGAQAVRIAGADSTLYEGMAVRRRDGKLIRQGYGKLYGRTDTLWAGQWQADTLVCGTMQSAAGYYSGGFDASLQPFGTGQFEGKDGEYYEGEWLHGQRNGHGFSSLPSQIVRCGDWKRGRFRGERMVYTEDRIYGIDISRYQHGKGKKKYAIDWKRLRITSLGNGRRVQGQVDYPVSFIYIKSTEGRTVFNRYYAADIRQARRHGIPAGTYHFFSLTSSGAQQASHFLRRSSVARGDLPPVLDLEPTDAQIRKAGGDARMFAEVMVWLRIVERRTGKRPVLYVSQMFVNDHLIHAPEALKDYDVWIARYGEFKPYVHLLHWQLTPHGRVRGIHGEVDINVFNGTRGQFADYLRRVRK